MISDPRLRPSRIGAAARLGAAVCALTGLFTAPAAAEWRRLDTPSFIVVGDVSARQLRDVAARFEGFRETLSRVIIYRTVGTDEQRVEGVLERIACPASPPATFTVRTAEGTQEFHAQKLSEVEFIAYRDDLTGGVACGPFDKPMRVFVTWKNGPRPGERRVVAVEFLR
jgi:hypothetical protein